MAISKDIVKNFIDSALKSEVLEDSFMPFTLPRNDDLTKSNGANFPPILITMKSSSEPDKIIMHYVNLMAQVKSTTKFDMLFDVLRLLVQQRPCLGKAICEALLSCERLDYYNQNTWMRSFSLISEILPHVDYKGVRDILKKVLEIIYSLPERIDTSIIPQLDTLYNTFSMILDREACLLPAYLGLDELQKRIAQGNAPVWKFAELLYHFIESFRPTAQIFSIINRPDLLPVVGYSTCQGNTSWRLDPISAKFQLKGLLPYRDQLKEPQVGLAKATLTDFLPINNLFDLLYSSRNQLPVPDENFPYLTHSLAAASIWLQLIKRADLDQVKILKPLPPSLKLHYEYLIAMKTSEESNFKVGMREVVFLNAHGPSKSGYPINQFIDSLCKVDPVHNPNPMLSQPIPMKILDALTTHSKITLLHVLVQRIVSIAKSRQPDAPQTDYILTPALIETYGRLFIYNDIESFGIKAFIGHLMGGPQAVWVYKAWDVYHVLLEMYGYRINHLSMHSKYQMLISLHNLSPMVYNANQPMVYNPNQFQPSNQFQLSMTMEAVELKLLLGLSNSEALNMPISTRHTNETKTAKHMINTDSEELNKVLVLVLARSSHLTSSEQVNSTFIEEILADINKITPLSWSSSTLSFFPSIIKNFFLDHASTKENDKAQLRPAVEEEYRKWLAMPDDDLFAHFSQLNGPPLFICIVWKMLIDSDTLNPVVYRILDTFRIRTLSAHLRTFVDYLVHEFSTSGAQHISKNSDALNKLVWRYQIISLDRLLLCMCLRSFDGCEAQVCFFIIQLLLLKSDFKPAAMEFCKMQTNEHWREENNCYGINSRFSASHPEKYYHDHLNENNIMTMGETLPSFFSNICLRFLPVFDIIIHRALELRILSPNSAMKIDQLLETYGCLYRFHEKPLTYLYNTLYYYDSQLPAVLKRKLTLAIVGAFNETRPQNWCLGDQMTQYIYKSSSNNQLNEEWTPGPDYYRKVIGRLVDTLQNKNRFYHTDWRFNEFPNVKAHAIYSTAIELMTLPVSPLVVGYAILDLVLTSYVNQDRSTMSQWMNAIGVIMTALPMSYYVVLNKKILEYMKSPLLTSPAYTKDILHLMNYCDSHEWMYESQISYLVALTHSIWHHSSTGLIFNLPTFWRMEVKYAVETESQFLFVCCLIGPFLSRLERSRVMMDVVVELYEMLGKVDSTSEIQHLNTISDFFYHIKYMFTGDAVKNEIGRCIGNFKPRLQYCLRFISPSNAGNEVLMRHD